MEASQVVLVVLIALTALALAIPLIVRAPGRALRKRFVALGTLKGRSRKEIVKAAGPPSTETALPDGRILLQWRATGYHIALLFEKNGRCVGVTHENGRRIQGPAGEGGQGG